MRLMSYSAREVPREVQWVWNMQMISAHTATPMGSYIIERCKQIARNYPEWFPKDPLQDLPVKRVGRITYL